MPIILVICGPCLPAKAVTFDHLKIKSTIETNMSFRMVATHRLAAAFENWTCVLNLKTCNREFSKADFFYYWHFVSIFRTLSHEHFEVFRLVHFMLTKLEGGDSGFGEEEFVQLLLSNDGLWL